MTHFFFLFILPKNTSIMRETDKLDPGGVDADYDEDANVEGECASCKQRRFGLEGWDKVASHFKGPNATWSPKWTCNTGRSNNDSTNYCLFVRCTHEIHLNFAKEVDKPELAWRYVGKDGSKETKRGDWLELIEDMDDDNVSVVDRAIVEDMDRIIDGNEWTSLWESEWKCCKNADLCVLSNTRQKKCSKCNKVRYFDGGKGDWCKATGLAPVEDYKEFREEESEDESEKRLIRWQCGTDMHREYKFQFVVKEYSNHDERIDTFYAHMTVWNVNKHSYCDFVQCVDCMEWRLLDPGSIWFKFVREVIKQKNPEADENKIMDHIMGDPGSGEWRCPSENIDTEGEPTCYIKNTKYKNNTRLIDQPNIILDPADIIVADPDDPNEVKLTKSLVCARCSTERMVSEESPLVTRGLKMVCLFGYELCKKKKHRDQEPQKEDATKKEYTGRRAPDDSLEGFYVRGLVLRETTRAWYDTSKSVIGIQDNDVRTAVINLLKRFDQAATKDSYTALSFWQTLHVVTELYIDVARKRLRPDWIQKNGWRYDPPRLGVDIEEDEDEDDEDTDDQVTVGDVLDFEVLSREFFSVIIDREIDDKSAESIRRLCTEYITDAEIMSSRKPSEESDEDLLPASVIKDQLEVLKSTNDEKVDIKSTLKKSLEDASDKVKTANRDKDDLERQQKNLERKKRDKEEQKELEAVNIKLEKAYKSIDSLQANETKQKRRLELFSSMLDRAEDDNKDSKRKALLDVAEIAIHEINKADDDMVVEDERDVEDVDEKDDNREELSERDKGREARTRVRDLEYIAKLILVKLAGRFLGDLAYRALKEAIENDDYLHDIVSEVIRGGDNPNANADAITKKLVEAYQENPDKLPYGLSKDTPVVSSSGANNGSVGEQGKDDHVRQIIEDAMKAIRSNAEEERKIEKEEEQERKKRKKEEAEEEEEEGEQEGEQEGEEEKEEEEEHYDESEYIDDIINMVQRALKPVVKSTVAKAKTKKAKKGESNGIQKDADDDQKEEDDDDGLPKHDLHDGDIEYLLKLANAGGLDATSYDYESSIMGKIRKIITENIKNDDRARTDRGDEMGWVNSLLGHIKEKAGQWSVGLLGDIMQESESMSIASRWNAMRLARDIIAKERVDSFITGTALESTGKRFSFNDVHKKLSPSSLRHDVDESEWKRYNGVRSLHPEWEQRMKNLRDPHDIFDYGIAQSVAMLLGVYVPNKIPDKDKKDEALARLYEQYEKYNRGSGRVFEVTQLDGTTTKICAEERMFRSMHEVMSTYNIPVPVWFDMQCDEDKNMSKMETILRGKTNQWAKTAMDSLRSDSTWVQILAVKDIWDNIGQQDDKCRHSHDILSALQALIEKGGYRLSIEVYEFDQPRITDSLVVSLPPLVDLEHTLLMLQSQTKSTKIPSYGYSVAKFGIVDPEVALEISGTMKSTSSGTRVLRHLAELTREYVQYALSESGASKGLKRVYIKEIDDVVNESNKSKILSANRMETKMETLLQFAQKAKKRSLAHPPLVLYYRSGHKTTKFNKPGWVPKQSREALLGIYDGYKMIWEATIGLEKKIKLHIAKNCANVRGGYASKVLELSGIRMMRVAIWANDRVRDLAAGSRVIKKKDQVSLLSMCSDIDRTASDSKKACAERAIKVLLDRMILIQGKTDPPGLNRRAIEDVLRDDLNRILIDDELNEAGMLEYAAKRMASTASSQSWKQTEFVCEITDAVDQEEIETKESAVSACKKVRDRMRIIDKNTAQMLMYLYNTKKMDKWTTAEQTAREKAIREADIARDKAALSLLAPLIAFVKSRPTLLSLLSAKAGTIEFGGPKKAKKSSKSNATPKRSSIDDLDDLDDLADLYKETPAPGPAPSNEQEDNVPVGDRDVKEYVADGVAERKKEFDRIILRFVSSTLDRVAAAMGAPNIHITSLLVTGAKESTGFGAEQKKAPFEFPDDRDKSDLDALVDMDTLALPHGPNRPSKFWCLLKLDLAYDELPVDSEYKLSKRSRGFLIDVLEKRKSALSMILKESKESSFIKATNEKLKEQKTRIKSIKQIKKYKEEKIRNEIREINGIVSGIREPVLNGTVLAKMREWLMRSSVTAQLLASSALFYEQNETLYIATPTFTGKYYSIGDIYLSSGGNRNEDGRMKISTGYDKLVLKYPVGVSDKARVFIEEVCATARLSVAKILPTDKKTIEDKDLKPIRDALEYASLHLALLSTSMVLYVHVSEDGRRVLVAEPPSDILGAPYRAKEQSRPEGPCVRSKHEIILETYQTSFGTSMGGFV